MDFIGPRPRTAHRSGDVPKNNIGTIIGKHSQAKVHTTKPPRFSLFCSISFSANCASCFANLPVVTISFPSYLQGVRKYEP